MRPALRGLALETRFGVHTGECERRGSDIGGIGVHIAARVMGLAAAGEILTTSTVKDLTAGSGIGFSDGGVQPLRGVPEPWHLFTATVGQSGLAGGPASRYITGSTRLRGSRAPPA